jgi:hypothetical protein
MSHVITSAPGIAVYAPVNTAPADIHAVGRGQNAFIFLKMHKPDETPLLYRSGNGPFSEIGFCRHFTLKPLNFTEDFQKRLHLPRGEFYPLITHLSLTVEDT